MDKLNYYVLQTDRMLAMYCKDAEERGVGLLTAPTIRAMDCLPSAGLSDDSGNEREDSSVESMNDDNDGDDSISAQSDTQNSNEHAISDDGNEQQVLM
jgi:hypothetical protein